MNTDKQEHWQHRIYDTTRIEVVSGTYTNANIKTNEFGQILTIENGVPRTAPANPPWWVVGTTVYTADFTAVVGEINMVDSGGGAITVTPPPSPSTGDIFYVVNSEVLPSINTITVDFIGSGEKLHGAVANSFIDYDGSQYTYVDSTIGWISLFYANNEQPA